MPQIVQRKKYLRILCMLWGALLVALAIQPERLVETFLPFSVLRDLAHAVIYGLMAFFLCMALQFQRRLGKIFMTFTNAAIGSLILTLGWGIFTEWLQNFVPGRCVSAKDVVYDMIGAAVGLTLLGLRQLDYAGQKLPKIRG